MPLHVCLFTLTAGAFDDRIYFKEALTLIEAGYRVSYIGPFPSGKTEDGVELINFGKASHLFQAKKNILRRIGELNPEIVQVYDPLFFRSMRRLKKMYGIRIIYNVSESYPDMYREFSRRFRLFAKIYSQYLKRKEHAFAAMWDGLIVTDSALLKRFSQFRKDVTLVHLYPPLKLFGIKAERKALSEEFKLVYVGQLRRERGIFTLLQALSKTSLSVQLHLYGGFDYSAEKRLFYNLIDDLNLKNRVLYHGVISHRKIPEVLINYDAGVVTLHPLEKFHKNEPTKLFEYMASGLPVIGSNFPPISEYIEKYQCGLVCNPKSAEEISKSIEYLIQNPDFYRKAGKSGRKAVETELNWESQAIKYLSVYKRLEESINR